MIKTKKGATKFRGTGQELCADLSVIIRSLHKEFTERYDEEFARDVLNRTMEVALLSEEELEQQKKETVTKILKTIVNDLESEEEADE